jgi:hypothetical protein
MPSRPLIAAAVAVLSLLAACSDPRTERRRIEGARVDAENAVLIASRMPKSVIFRNETVRLRPGGPVVCGEFNGQNRRLEWVGFVRFIRMDGDTWMDDGGAVFAERWRAACGAR